MNEPTCLKSQSCSVVALWLWAGYPSALGLSVLICKIGKNNTYFIAGRNKTI